MTPLHPYFSIDASREATIASRKQTAYAVAEHSSRLLFTAAAVSVIAFAAFNSPLFGLIAFFAAFRLAPEFQSKIREPLRTHKNENALIAHLWKRTAFFLTQTGTTNVVHARYLALNEAVKATEAKKQELTSRHFTDERETALNAFEIYRLEESDDLDLRRVGIMKGNLEKAYLLHVMQNARDHRTIEAFGDAHPRSRFVRDGTGIQEYFTLTNSTELNRDEFLESEKVSELARKIFLPVNGADDRGSACDT